MSAALNMDVCERPVEVTPEPADNHPNPVADAAQEAPTPPADYITVLRSRTLPFAKTIVDLVGAEAAGFPALVDGKMYPLSGMPDLGRLLINLRDKPQKCIIRGLPVSGPRVNQVPRRYCGVDPAFKVASHHWLGLDLDGIDVPLGYDRTDLKMMAMLGREVLPPEFYHAQTIVQATSNHGIKPGARLRMWFWLDRPVSDVELKTWLHEVKVDKSIFCAVTPHFTATPRFAEGFSEHLPCRIDFLRGDQCVPVPATFPQPAAKTPKVKVAPTATKVAPKAKAAVVATIKAAPVVLATDDLGRFIRDPAELRAPIAKVRSAVAEIPNGKDVDWDEWTRFALAISGATSHSQGGREVFHTFSKKHPRYDADTTDDRWDEIGNCQPDDIGFGTLAFKAAAANPNWSTDEPRVPPEDEFDCVDTPEPPAPLLLKPGLPLASAREFVKRRYMVDGCRALLRHDGGFKTWNGAHYRDAEEEGIRSGVYRFLETAQIVIESGEGPIPFNPDQCKVSNVIDALKAITHLPTDKSAPAWLDDGEHPPASEFLACKNGLLHLPTREVSPHTPNFFVQNALDFDFSPGAQVPTEWLTFLTSLWPGDDGAIDTLQEMFGLFLTLETRHQKLFLLIGPKRSGKGTIARVLTRLLGQANVGAPTLSSLAENFGMAPLIGKPLAIIADARLGAGVRQAAITERLLAVSGEDSLTLDRKNITAWTGRLPTRFLIISNEIPRLTDVSGALASRFVILTLRQSFLGKEDIFLDRKLMPELPGILNWAIDGWLRLQQRGYFVTPASSLAAVRTLEDLGSDVHAFLRERCVIGAGEEVSTEALYTAWTRWCVNQGHKVVTKNNIFGRDLSAAAGDFEKVQHTVSGQRLWFYVGIGLSPDPDLPLADL